jgi:serine/threonine protein kinase
MNSLTSSTCPKCGGAVPEGAPQGVCPRCLLQQAMQPTVVLRDPPPAPPDADIVAAFPQFEILQLVGAGGMGRVYKVRQRHLDRVAALKLLPRELAADPAFAERFTREGRALAKLSHPNIVGVFDFGISGDYYWLLMEYVDGVNLRQAMHAEAMKPSEALHIIPSICAALEYAHGQGVLHRDIKPENILIDTAGRVKIADFGVAKLRGEEGRHVSLTLSGSALGTPAYMAPEQIERPQDVDHRADIYSLGVVFYEMLTGELPLGRFPAPSETSGVDPRLDSVVFRTLEKQRERRWQSAGEMKTQVESVAGAPLSPPFAVPASGAPPAPQRHPAERTSRKAVCGFVLVILGLVLSMGGMLVTRVSVERDTQRRYQAQNRQESQRAQVLEIIENARRGLLSREQVDQMLRGLKMPESWYTPPSPPTAPEPPDAFLKRMEDWQRSFDGNPLDIPPPPRP